MASRDSRSRRELPAACLAVLVAAAGARSVGAGGPPHPEADPTGPVRRASDIPAIGEMFSPLGKFIAGNAILLADEVLEGDSGGRPAWAPLPPQARVLAFEEHRDFLCVVGDASPLAGGPKDARAASASPRLVRRFFVLKPSVFVVDDQVRHPAAARVRWALGALAAPGIAGRRVTIGAGGEELVCVGLAPEAVAMRARAGRGAGDAPPASWVEEIADAAPGDVRFLHVLHVRRQGEAADGVRADLESVGGELVLALSTPQRIFRLSLPPAGVGAGHLEVREAGGKVLVSRRPLPSGILPHGPEAVRLLERWDRAYRDGRRPPWDLGAPAAELRKAVEEGTIRPGHALEVGCGSGTDAVYLASQGFKVTAVDIAPTALAIAEAKARTAGVRVEWLLADVLALPDIGPFDFVYDRGCYHNVRYVDAAGFIEGLRRVSRPGTRCLILSLNRSGPPGVTEERMRGDFARGFEVEWLRPADIGAGPPGPKKPNAWSLLLRRRSEPAP